MPRPGHQWYHAMISLYGHWPTGDPRGFRHKHHRIHSSGDYKHRPPPDEHAGLRRWVKRQMGEPTRLTQSQRQDLGRALRDRLVEKDFRVAAVAMCRDDTHLLIEGPGELAEAKRLVGHVKKSMAVRFRDLPAKRLWARGCDLKPVRDQAYFRNLRTYITDHVGEGAWTWDATHGDNPPLSDRVRRKYDP